MTNFMPDLYYYFIKPYIQDQPIDELFEPYFDRHKATATVDQRDDTNWIRQFYAIHGFILGLKLGLALAEELREPG